MKQGSWGWCTGDDPEGWDGEECRRGGQDGEHMYKNLSNFVFYLISLPSRGTTGSSVTFLSTQAAHMWGGDWASQVLQTNGRDKWPPVPSGEPTGLHRLPVPTRDFIVL